MAEDVHERRHDFQAVLASLFFVLAVTGGALHYRHDRRGFWYFGPLMLLMTVVLIYYLNFRYGYSWPDRPEITRTMREVRERDYFFVGSFAFFGTLVAAGIGALASVVTTRVSAVIYRQIFGEDPPE